MTKPYHLDNTDTTPPYDTLVGPDGFECTLTEAEDRTFSRDLSCLIDRLNKQHQDLDVLKDALKKASDRLATIKQSLDTYPATKESLLLEHVAETARIGKEDACGPLGLTKVEEDKT